MSCACNKLVELPRLPQSLVELYCNDNNIKYLSENNCMVIKKFNYSYMKRLQSANNSPIDILNNPVSSDFNNNYEFVLSL